MTTRIKSTVIAIAATLIVAAGPATAAQNGNVALSGNVPQNCSIAVTATGNSGIDLSTTTADLQVATIAEDCNKRAGYVIAVTTTNGVAASASTGLFNGDTGGNSDTVAYSVKYNSSSLTLTNGADSSARSVSSKVSGQVSPVTISFTGDATAAADTYADTLNFTMTVN
jgi:hypothetical protein